ncbi:hypothetical protein ADUPG1_010766 [Aduncisulcus paluster]|uniref:Uncharacterized protein n=1 Tax=Aduncisulcus paluster TaxID=2918883 RepID=A0ABQ5JSQ6_9EUKA|nr:hypothetical protein ADUPG1_010766 [Aduncisulcus paluster]
MLYPNASHIEQGRIDAEITRLKKELVRFEGRRTRPEELQPDPASLPKPRKSFLLSKKPVYDEWSELQKKRVARLEAEEKERLSQLKQKKKDFARGLNEQIQLHQKQQIADKEAKKHETFDIDKTTLRGIGSFEIERLGKIDTIRKQHAEDVLRQRDEYRAKREIEVRREKEIDNIYLRRRVQEQDERDRVEKEKFRAQAAKRMKYEREMGFSSPQRSSQGLIGKQRERAMKGRMIIEEQEKAEHFREDRDRKEKERKEHIQRQREDASVSVFRKVQEEEEKLRRSRSPTHMSSSFNSSFSLSDHTARRVRAGRRSSLDKSRTKRSTSPMKEYFSALTAQMNEQLEKEEKEAMKELEDQRKAIQRRQHAYAVEDARKKAEEKEKRRIYREDLARQIDERKGRDTVFLLSETERKFNRDLLM